MKEFSEDIESRLGKAFKSKAGKKYGLSDAEIEMRKVLAQPNFGSVKDSMRDVDSQARSYLSNINTKFLKKNLLADRL